MINYLILLYLLTLYACDGGKIKLVEEPFAFNNAPIGNSHYGERAEVPLVTRYIEMKPSGPAYLIENLNGKCYDYISNNYKYRLCPFHNVTQKEQTYRWNSFNGVLGVWKEWLIKNDSFDYMHMLHGDVCSNILDREVKVKLACGLKDEIISVSEPSMCKYEMLFKTQFACPKDVFLVYPMLSDQGKQTWRLIEQQYVNKEITLKGYHAKREELFYTEELKHSSMKQRNHLNDVQPQKRLYTPVFPTEYKVAELKEENGDDSKHSSILSLATLMRTIPTKTHCVQKYRDTLIELEELRETLRSVLLQKELKSEQLKAVYPTDKLPTTSSLTKKDSRINLQNGIQNKKGDNLAIIENKDSIELPNQKSIDAVENIDAVEKKDIVENIDAVKNIDAVENIYVVENIDAVKKSADDSYTLNKQAVNIKAKTEFDSDLKNTKQTILHEESFAYKTSKERETSKMSRKGDDGLLDENDNPMRLLHSRIVKKMKNLTRLHENERKIHFQPEKNVNLNK